MISEQTLIRSPATDCYPPVLDMCCGPKMMWFDKDDERALFVDKRREQHEMQRPKRGTVEYTETDPDIIGDFTDLPFPDHTFSVVVFDPPHFERSGKIGYLAMKYGWLDGDWRSMVKAGFAEGFRVLRPGGTLIFKWTATENPVSEILKLTAERPLFGHKSGKQSQTHWIAFMKTESATTAKQVDELQHATDMAAMWQYRGNRASERGDGELAERHYERSQKWRDRMNVLLGNGDGG